MKKHYSAIILTGALWGIAEATAGHLLHTFSLGIGWLIWFPMAYFFLHSIYHITQKPKCMLYAAVLAAGIKMINIFYTPRPDIVINPAVSIILEALAVFAVYSYLLREKSRLDLTGVHILVFGFAWRILYICYLLYLPRQWIEISCLSDMVSFAKFLFLENLLNSVLILSAGLLYKKSIALNYNPAGQVTLILNKHKALKPALSLAFLFISILVQIKL